MLPIIITTLAALLTAYPLFVLAARFDEWIEERRVAGFMARRRRNIERGL